MNLEDLVAPAPHPRFREELWERVDARQRLVARRWRVAAIVATAAAVAAGSGAGVLAFGAGGGGVAATTFDQTRSCPVSVQGGIPIAQLHAHATYTFTSNAKAITLPAGAGFDDPGPAGASLGGVGQAQHGYGFSTDICKRAPRIPLARSGLPFYGVFKTGEPGFGSLDNGARCWVGTRITVRVRAIVGANDTPVSGAVAMRTGKRKLRPMAYIEWTPKRVAVWMSPDCHPA